MVTGGAMPFAIFIGGNDAVPAFPAPWLSKAILTGYRVAKKAGLGLSHTLMERIYAHIFGEKAGVAMVTGLGFAGMCNTRGGYVGFDAVHAYFDDVNASNQGAPVTLIFGPRTSISGMMTELEFSVDDPSTGLGSFSFQFRTFPRSKRALPFLSLLIDDQIPEIPPAEGDAELVGG